MNHIRPKYILTLLVVCLAFSGLVFANGGGRTDLPDSILTEDHIYKYLYTDRSKSERIMAEMRRHGGDAPPEYAARMGVGLHRG